MLYKSFLLFPPLWRILSGSTKAIFHWAIIQGSTRDGYRFVKINSNDVSLEMKSSRAKCDKEEMTGLDYNHISGEHASKDYEKIANYLILITMKYIYFVALLILSNEINSWSASFPDFSAVLKQASFLCSLLVVVFHSHANFVATLEYLNFKPLSV